MTSCRVTVLLAIAAGCMLLAIAALCAAEPAHSLPGVLTGHVGAGDPEFAHDHVKHAIAALAIGLGAFAYAWFATGPATTRRTA